MEVREDLEVISIFWCPACPGGKRVLINTPYVENARMLATYLYYVGHNPEVSTQNKGS